MTKKHTETHEHHHKDVRSAEQEEHARHPFPPPAIPSGPPDEPPPRSARPVAFVADADFDGIADGVPPSSPRVVARSFVGVVPGAISPITAPQVRSALATVFPSSPPASIDKLTSSVLSALQAGVTPPPAPVVGGAGTFQYYMANARHIRTHGANKDFSDFTGHLSLVRFRLPATGDFVNNIPPVVATPMGFLLPNDRKIASLETLPQLTNGRKAARVDLITPPRSPNATDGARFGAIALYLGYTNVDDAAPSFFILEAGTATGAPMVLYYSPEMGPIVNAQSNYKPTPFSQATNYYNAWLTMTPGSPGDPQSLIITSTDTSVDPNAPPYMQIRITYGNLGSVPPSYDPLSLILHAAARVGVIGDALHEDPGLTEDIAKVLLGWTLDWNVKPVG